MGACIERTGVGTEKCWVVLRFEGADCSEVMRSFMWLSLKLSGAWRTPGIT